MPQKNQKTHIFKKIKKRNGKIVSFKKEKIAMAIGKAGIATGEFDMDKAEELTERVLWLTQDRIDGANSKLSKYKILLKKFWLVHDIKRQLRPIFSTATNTKKLEK